MRGAAVARKMTSYISNFYFSFKLKKKADIHTLNYTEKMVVFIRSSKRRTLRCENHYHVAHKKRGKKQMTNNTLFK